MRRKNLWLRLSSCTMAALIATTSIVPVSAAEVDFQDEASADIAEEAAEEFIEETAAESVQEKQPENPAVSGTLLTESERGRDTCYRRECRAGRDRRRSRG